MSATHRILSSTMWALYSYYSYAISILFSSSDEEFKKNSTRLSNSSIEKWDLMIDFLLFGDGSLIRLPVSMSGISFRIYFDNGKIHDYFNVSMVRKGMFIRNSVVRMYQGHRNHFRLVEATTHFPKDETLTSSSLCNSPSPTYVHFITTISLGELRLYIRRLDLSIQWPSY